MIDLPTIFIKRIESQSYIDSGQLIASLNGHSPVSVRINSSKFQGVPEDSEPVPWCDTGWYLASRPSFTADPLFHAGCYYPQEASSMFAGYLFKQLAGNKEGLRILDLCGAPGGKTSHLSSLAGKGSVVVANDVIRSRAAILDENISRWGLGNCIVTSDDPRNIGKLRGYFDIILADAPCSGEGMFRDEVARKEWSEANAKLCSERQSRILTDIWPALKSGGSLIYSTCTFNPSENEENVARFAAEIGAESVRMDTSEFSGIVEIFHSGIYGYGFYPGRVKGEGFFISVLRKRSGEDENAPAFKAKQLEGLSSKLEARISLLVEPGSGSFAVFGENITLVPAGLKESSFLFSNLNVINQGTPIARIVGNDLIPAHSLALTLALRKEAFPVTELGYPEAITFLKRGTLNSGKFSSGWNLVSYLGIPLGFVKNIGNRVNNYFPVGQRIRMDVNPEMYEKIIRWKEL
jgi:16S rRNA C967 or C1407 C5-methylase (RsmB/RsmF family)/NOL1/NOP2/fmu family ribosome biogenesis protein